MEIIIGLTIPFLGTVIGAAMVFMFRDRISGLLSRYCRCDFSVILFSIQSSCFNNTRKNDINYGRWCCKESIRY